jgi:hypothetical protein
MKIVADMETPAQIRKPKDKSRSWRELASSASSESDLRAGDHEFSFVQTTVTVKMRGSPAAQAGTR